MSKRVMLYSHDTFGLGHIRRTQKIANAIAAKDRSILIACSSPMASSFASQPGIEHLNLPGITKQISGEYLPRSLNLPMEEFVALRSSLLLTAVKNFRPDVLIVDKEPLGVKGELLASLQYLREERPGTKIVCGFRDILDSRELIGEEWKRKGVMQALELYDAILVYGEKRIFDFCQEYALPEKIASKVNYTGYIQPAEDDSSETFPLKFAAEKPIVTLTLGGGGDGSDFIELFLTLIEQDLAGNDLNFVLLAGPFASKSVIERARSMAATRSDFLVFGFTADAPSLFKRSRLVISMGGYNSLVELASQGKFPLVLPRLRPREEQLIRAKVFHREGFCDFIHPGELGPEVLAKKINCMIEANLRPSQQFSATGIDRVRTFIEEALECRQKSDSFSKVIPA